MKVKNLLKSAARVAVTTVALALLIGTLCINMIMFHPVKGGYDEKTEGYVDIGTNGVKVAAIVLDPERGISPSQGLRRGKKAILRCHGNAEDAAGTLCVLRDLASEGYTVASVDYPGAYERAVFCHHVRHDRT